ncbi:FAD-binding oxidoreductase [Amycolatopsis jiangsuensis]|uniref:Glycolate oxidase n=1 Tax=Amycolatopsis jiangsuensis TaxID=1181879 RepID=A0A840IQM6_9PSEU|nr:FAD-linked oxidase C-terminal domain-containing protein [Amycolatopsis jiangsuensis]MBB4683512.1 glycolate oxidase [Amycolatopsis jiangsuensis]
MSVPLATTDLTTALAAVLPGGTVQTDPDVLAAHSCDHASTCPAGVPACLVRPRTTEEVSAVLRYAYEHRIPVVPQGARTGLSGGANAVDGAILLSLERMTAILGIDEDNQIATVEPGVVNAEFSRAVARRGLFYPPDPSSWEMSTLGGNVATNAGGLCCVKYGVTADWIRGLEVVLADGRVLRTGRDTAKGVAGYDLTRLFTGSEGTLGVVTKIVTALRPAAEAPRTAIAFFGDLGSACATVTDVMTGGLRPSLLELIDPVGLAEVSRERDYGFPPGTSTVLIAQSDSVAEAEGVLGGFTTAVRRHGGEALVADDPEEGKLFLAARRSVGLVLEKRGALLSDDVCVPRTRLRELVAGVGEIGDRLGVRIACTGHAGDGNMHPTIVFDAADPDEKRRAEEAFEAVMALGLRLGGTITGEHGVGLLKRGWLERELGPVGLDAHRWIKTAFDPRSILNPGKVLARF